MRDGAEAPRMARDHEFYELAASFPEACLALLGVRPAEPYRGASIEVKRSSRRVDVVLVPVSPASVGPIFVVELWRYGEPGGDEKLLRKTLDVAEQRGVDRVRVVAVAVYVTAAMGRGVRRADVGPPSRRTIAFRPRRVVLRRLDPASLLRRGGSALAVLPLVGRDDDVRRHAKAWRRRLKQTATLDATERAEVERLFLLLLADRFDRTALSTILGEEGLMPLEKTATGREIFARGAARGRKEGEARGEARGRLEGEASGLRRAVEEVVRGRFGRLPRAIGARLRGVDDARRLVDLVREVASAATLADVTALLR